MKLEGNTNKLQGPSESSHARQRAGAQTFCRRTRERDSVSLLAEPTNQWVHVLTHSQATGELWSQ